eukprot:Rhum_TRINITY_DN14583_c14_g1::Rhum_TRINITY_DN14583_c14_g1_i5::g.101327::m.101327
MNHASEASRLCGVLFSLFIQTPPPAPPTPPSPPSVCVIVCRGKLRHGRKLRLQTRAITMVTLSAPEHGPGPASLATEPSSSLSPSPSSSSSSSVPAGSPESLPKLEEIDDELNDLMMSIEKVESKDTRVRSDTHPECCGYSLTTDRGVYHVLHARELRKIPVGAVHYRVVSDEYRGLDMARPLPGDVVDKLQTREEHYTHVNYAGLRDGCMPLTLTADERKAWMKGAPKAKPVPLHDLVHLTHGGTVVHNMVGTSGLSEAYSVPSLMNEKAKKYREALEIHNTNRKHSGCGAEEDGEPCVTVTTSPSLCHVALTADTSNLYSNMARQYLEDRKNLGDDQPNPADLTCYGVFACSTHNGRVRPFKVHKDAPLFRMKLSFCIPSQ